ncbi:GNAT family N-acetyltransferase [Ensifer sp. Root31]|uniref:GNAT family N-acetyltransferase n=1 Tax=Ensifer sp. Root31 TaxID=1736512 RepID=UPI000709C385|nr:GNAT family protein [Ensifer sp. Root31]KQU86027.1 GCN5 family acetyltransferase [Ensifer sp. Root31]
MNASSTPPPELKGQGFHLRRPEGGDVEARLALGRDPEIHRMFGGSATFARAFGQADAEAWVQHLVEHPAAWIIDRNGPIGEVRLDNINRVDRRASFAIGIFNPKLLGQGLGTAVTKLVLAHAFGALGLHRVSLRVLAFNERAIASYRKCGFSVEGRERETALIDDAWHDDIMMGILAHEFSAAKDKSQEK